MKIDIPVEDGKVISLELVRAARNERQYTQKCLHRSIVVDVTLESVSCKDCGEKLHAAGWIGMMIEYWSYLQYQTTAMKEATARYEAKKRCRCEHCNKITTVRPATAAQIREFSKESK